MKVLPFQIPKPTNDALIYQEDIALAFYNQLHQHQEIQLSFIAFGTGTLITTDSVTSYTTGDIFCIGSNMPHVFQSDLSSSEPSQMLSLFFTKDGFGHGFFDLAELAETATFFRQIDFGFRVESQHKAVSSVFRSLNSQNKLDRFTSFLLLLRLLSKAKKAPLSAVKDHKQYSTHEGKRIRDVMAFSLDNFQRPIQLREVAHIASMTTNAFCKYFKKRTNKSYMQFLNEIRVERAGQLLANKDSSVADVAFACGFGNLSNFNRRFKEVKDMTPTAFRKKL